jgi:alkanesulfonate monooxygenase SsuD/methylene tetrahydromethanopterin reductase-like flavin-dependent oxidoreductase (luciferase family)
MEVGASLRTSYFVEDVREGARWILERAVAARDADLDCLLVGDHHVSPIPYYQNVPMLARLLAAWSDRPFGPLFLLPLWPPLLVAEQVGTLAALAPGRVILPCAVGGGSQQFAGMGIELSGRAARFEAGLDIVRRLLAGETVSAGDPVSAEHPYRLHEARISPIPPDPVEIWIGGTAPRAVERAARLGDGFLANADLTPAEAREVADRYLTKCSELGRTPTAVAIRRDIHVGADAEDAARVAAPIVDGGYRGFHPSACTYGGVEQVAEHFAELAAMGYTSVITRHLAEDQGEVLASHARLGQVRQLVAGL